MPIDRQRIEKRDFPIGRSGYDPEAVDAHLASIAEEVELLKTSSRRRSETLASSASEQVRAIVEAAEVSANEIQRQAEDDAAEIRADATQEAQATRQQATSQAREYVGNVSESTASMLQRLDAMESELSALLESLRTGANRLSADLQLLEGNLDEVTTSVAPRPRFEPEAPPARPRRAPVAAPAPRPEFVPFEDEEIEPEPLPAPPVAARATVVEAQVEEIDDETDGARLVALNMALNGTPRADTEQYLAQNFTLRDRAALLDEVYASIEG